MPKDEEILEQAKKRFQEIVDFESSERINMEDDKAFSLGQDNAQWDQDDVSSREADGRPFITVMRSNQFTDHVKNGRRQIKTSIKISPTDEGAQEKIATRRQGLVRAIQYESKASQARQHGFDDSVDEGRGHWCVRTEYVPGTFVERIVVDPIKYSRTVFMDIHRERPDYSDCQYGFILKSIPRETFKEDYPDAEAGFWNGVSEEFWTSKDTVTIAEYFYCDKVDRTLIEVEIEGETRILFEDELKDTDKKTLNITQKRKVKDPQWKWCEITTSDILKKEDLPWKEIPIITVIGKEDVVKNRWCCKGLIRDLKQPLRLYNFTTSLIGELLAKQPMQPFMMAEGQEEGHEDEFTNTNISNEAYLTYKPVTVGGVMAPAPQRVPYSPVPTGLENLRQTAIDDCKAVTGIYDSSVGARSNETSGIAIKRREMQSERANMHFDDNMQMAVAHEGRVINSALAIIYDTARTVTIMGEDDEEEMIGVNGQDDIGLGNPNSNWQVTVSTGPSTNTQREEQAAGMLEMYSKSPFLQEGATDLVIRAQDWHGKDALADRAEALIDIKYDNLTKIVKPEEGENDELAMMQQQLQQCQQQLQQMQQQMQQTQEALDKAQADKQAAEAQKQQNAMQELQLKSQEIQLQKVKIEGELRLKQQELKNEMLIADLNSSKDVEINKSKLEVDLIKEANNQDHNEKTRADAKVTVEPAKPAEKPAPKPADQVVNVYGSKVKESVITTPEGKKYNVVTEEKE